VIGVPFLLGDFLCQSINVGKEKYLARGCENPLPKMLQTKRVKRKTKNWIPACAGMTAWWAVPTLQK
jgi:hypothetical protein